MQRTVFAAFLGAVIIIMGFTACSEERYWTPDQSTGEEIRDIMKENWDLIEDVWGDADCGDFPDGSGSKSMMAVRSIVVPGIMSLTQMEKLIKQRIYNHLIRVIPAEERGLLLCHLD